MSWRRETERGLAVLVKSGVAIRASSEAELAAFAEASARSRQAHAQGPVAELAATIVAAIGVR